MRGLRFGALFALVAAIGLLGATGSFAASTTGATTSISADSERTSAVSPDRVRCGPCPGFIFGKGSGSGTIVATTWKLTGPEVQTCVIPPPGHSDRNCPMEFDEVSSTTLEARPASDSRFEHWQGCPDAEGPVCELGVGASIRACVVFRVRTEPQAEDTTLCPPPALLLYKSGEGAGSVTVTPGNNPTCDANCRVMSLQRWAQGTTLTLNAQASSGSRFVRWDGACASATGPTCSFPLTTVAEVCPVFVKDGSVALDDRSCPPRVTPPRDATPPPLGSRCTRTLRGSNGPDVITGTSGNDVICGLGGNDVIYGKGGHDLLVGGGGTDKLYGQAGNDRIVGGSGKDRLYGAAGTDIFHARDRARDLVNGGLGSDRARVDRGDTLRSIERRF